MVFQRYGNRQICRVGFSLVLVLCSDTGQFLGPSLGFLGLFHNTVMYVDLLAGMQVIHPMSTRSIGQVRSGVRSSHDPKTSKALPHLKI